MDKVRDVSRRAALSAPAAMLLAAGASACKAEDQQATGAKSNTLVAYFTRSGNTRVIAEQLQRDLSADLFQIVPEEAYPADYEQNVEQARLERDRGFEPPLKGRVTNIAAYGTVFLGFPIWGETAPPPIRSFLRTHDLAGKTVRPFITHGGYGLGDSLSVLKAHAPSARILAPFVMEADQERRTMTQVRQWLAVSLPASRKTG
ncbi:flavodoxin [Caulobacter sp. 3R27C2-B]|uniref:flavodoxin n=1 Tax=Caulobacter sp. 3R27C2-B TaxID=2502219 RepID=UPI0010F8AF4F|nr:flavodoxin [Caulobacter sp. 3R27C2-B]